MCLPSRSSEKRRGCFNEITPSKTPPLGGNRGANIKDPTPKTRFSSEASKRGQYYGSLASDLCFTLVDRSTCVECIGLDSRGGILLFFAQWNGNRHEYRVRSESDGTFRIGTILRVAKRAVQGEFDSLGLSIQGSRVRGWRGQYDGRRRTSECQTLPPRSSVKACRQGGYCSLCRASSRMSLVP